MWYYVPMINNNKTSIGLEECAMCGERNFCVMVFWAEDYDKETGQALGKDDWTCAKCMDPETHESQYSDLKEYLEEECA